MVRRTARRRQRRNRPSQRGPQVFIENMRIKIPAATTLSIPRSVVELAKDRSITLTKFKVQLTGTIGAQANAGALICQVRLMGLEQTLGFKWTSGPFMVASGSFTTKIFNIPRKYQYIMPRDVPDNFIILNFDHVCADKTLDTTAIHGLLHLYLVISQEQVLEACPAVYIYRRDGSPTLASSLTAIPPSQSTSFSNLSQTHIANEDGDAEYSAHI